MFLFIYPISLHYFANWSDDLTLHLIADVPTSHWRAPPILPEKTEDEGDQLAWIQAMVNDRFKREVALSSPVRECFFAEDGSPFR